MGYGIGFLWLLVERQNVICSKSMLAEGVLKARSIDRLSNVSTVDKDDCFYVTHACIDFSL